MSAYSLDLREKIVESVNKGYSPDLNPIEEAFRGGQASAEEDRRPHQEVPGRGDGPSVGSREYRRRESVLRSLWLLRPGAATVKTLLMLSPTFLKRRVALTRQTTPST